MDGARPKVGVGLLVFKDDKLLLGKRKPGHMGGVYAGPGGHLEFGETFEECAVRETREETGIEIENIRLITVSNLLIWEGKHYVDIGMAADWKSGEPQLMEPDKCEGWAWYGLDELPQPLSDLDPMYLDALSSGKLYLGTVR